MRKENSFTVGKKKERISETGRKKKGENYEKEEEEMVAKWKMMASGGG